MARRDWMPAEIDTLVRLYPTTTAPELAAALGRSVGSVYLAAHARGLRKATRARGGRAFLAELRRINRLGIPDTGAARVLGCDRHTVSKWRERLGLPSHARGERYRERVAEATARQCRDLGVSSFAEVRSLSFKLRAIVAGWPADLRPREVQIVEALSARGPMTRREIADAIGMPWKGSRKSLTGSVPGGTYLAHLVSLGLVVSLGRVGTVRGRGRGYSVQVYSLALSTERKAAHG